MSEWVRVYQAVKHRIGGKATGFVYLIILENDDDEATKCFTQLL